MTIPSLNWDQGGTREGASLTVSDHRAVIAGDLGRLGAKYVIDPSRTDLGAEGFELDTVDDPTVIAATETGRYRGAVSLAQLMRSGSLPVGRAVSVPVRAERGVTVSASTVIFSRAWCTWLLDTMGNAGLNQLLLEAKLEDADPRLNTWPYWTRSEVAELVEMARARHIEIIPEVNSPGHMATLLHYYPQYAVRRADGSVDTERLDIGSDEAIGFYLDLVDRYLDAFDSTWWHMGADEYEYHSITYDHFPSLATAAVEKFGDGATPSDLFISFINTVNAHVKSRGKRLRIWNDGIGQMNKVELDPDIRIEYWLTRGQTPLQLHEAGYELMNAAQYMYWSRSVRDVYGIDSASLYAKLDLTEFDNGDRVEDMTGAKVSIWPDMAYAQTEHEIAIEARDSLYLVAEGTWNGRKPDQTWEDFSDDIEAVALEPVWEDSITGTHEIPLLDQLAPGPWTIEATNDGYVTLTSADGRRLATGDGRRVMGVVMEVGAPVVLADPVDMGQTWLSDQENAEARNTQKWIVPDTETIVAALSGLHVGVIGDQTHVDLDGSRRGDLGLLPPELA